MDSNERKASDLRVSLEESWEIVASLVEPFINAWESEKGPPILDDFLPDGGSHYLEVLAELVKVDIDYRRQFQLGGDRVEDYAELFPELRVDGAIPYELIAEELHIRRAHGESIDAEEYFERFPEHRSLLEQTFVGESDTFGVGEDGRPRHAVFQPGDRLGDFYLMSKLGEGGFASVYLARQEAMQRLVALKISADKGSEAQTLAQLDHQHVVRVFDEKRLDGERLLLVYMQFAPGGTLQSLIRLSRLGEANERSGRLVGEAVRAAVAATGILAPEDVLIRAELEAATWAELTCQYGLQLAAALDYAHAHGVLHRDLKPANVLLDATGSCKLADFNISFAAEVAGQEATQSFGGSVAYMPPEQLAACHPGLAGDAHDLDERSDIYALGVLLWEMQTGLRPFDESSLGTTWSQTLETMIERRQSDPTVGEWNDSDEVEYALKSLLRRCLEPNAADRFTTAKQLGEALATSCEPRMATLINRHRSGWKRIVGGWPAVSVTLIAVALNVPAALFALFYNSENLRRSLADPEHMAVFDRVQSMINGAAFPAAIVLLLWYLWPMAKFLSSQLRFTESDAEECRKRLLKVPVFGAIVGISEWTIAAIAYPTALHLLVGGISAETWGHFFFSHIVSGMIAASYPFFLITYVSLHVLLPRWIERNDQTSLADFEQREFASLQHSMNAFLYVAGGVPAAGILAMLLLSSEIDSHHLVALKLLSVAGALGFAVVFRLYSTISGDVAVIKRTIATLHTTN